jgi:integrase
MKLKLPKNHLTGMKIYCNKCKKDNSTCKHYANQCYRFRLHVAGTKNKIKSKVLKSKIYDEALSEAIEFKNEIIKNDYQTVVVDEVGNDYSVVDAILKYYQYLSGEHQYAHKRKTVTEGHRDESIRFCKYFANVLRRKYDISIKRIVEVNQYDVADFYLWAEGHYAPKTFNKCMGGVKSFFDFIIDVEEIEMKNPFRKYVSKHVGKSKNETLTKEEFETILNSIGVVNPIKLYGDSDVRKNMYYPYLKDSFKLFLLTGCRREEVVSLKWSNIFITVNNIKFFKICNLKVQKSNYTKNIDVSIAPKYIPINSDLSNLLIDMGYNDLKNSDEYILYPKRKITDKTLMDKISKSFTHYKEQSGIEKDVSLKNLRKTYLSWVNVVMMGDTKLLSSHTSDSVLEKHYLDPTILSSVEKGALEIKIFGT